MTDTSDSFSTTGHEDIFNRTALTPPHERMQTFCKQMLKTRTFLGHYQENRLVQSLQSYRSLVVISKTDEALSTDMQLVRNRIKHFYGNPEFWVGYTDSDMIGVPHGSCIWTELEGLAFGEYWFQIKTIRFRNNEALIKLKMLKPKLKEKESNYDSGQLAKDFKELIEMWRKSISEYFLWLFSQQITAQNIANTLKFICLVIFAIGTASIHGLIYIGSFTLKLMEEFRKLVHVSTPIILKIVDLVSKIIGGFFILLAMIWKDTVGRKDSNVHNQQMPMPEIYTRSMPTVRPIEFRPDVRNSRDYANVRRFRSY